MRFRKITIIRTQTQPEDTNINELLQWFGGSLGLFNPRDKDKSCYRVFLALLKDVKRPIRGLTSDQLAEITSLTRGTVVHHLNRLMESGIVVSERSQYFLRVDTMEELVDVVKKHVNKTFEGLKDIGQAIDKHLDL